MSRTRQTDQQQKGKQIPPNQQGNKYKGNNCPYSGKK